MRWIKWNSSRQGLCIIAPSRLASTARKHAQMKRAVVIVSAGAAVWMRLLRAWSPPAACRLDRCPERASRREQQQHHQKRMAAPPTFSGGGWRPLRIALALAISPTHTHTCQSKFVCLSPRVISYAWSSAAFVRPGHLLSSRTGQAGPRPDRS
jgi:hypothetical protein